MGQYVVFAPLEKATLKPDLVLFVVNAEIASRLLQTSWNWPTMSRALLSRLS
ncbi:DUF169 domain-containing protein [Neomoorella humiferrea]|uniref:DUF169 domain-containing protein n=1 Tax=Neomoorella humiferrea TaxID=676965 RepID=UPI000D03DE05|nr:DUF169 domain-containing protein [Moorella humiferrea]